MALFPRSADIEVIDPSVVPEWVSEITIGQFFQVATVTVLVYDALITMDKEIKFFWRFPLKTVNIVYFAIRYIGIFGAIASLFCKLSQWASDVANWITIISIDYILVIRVLALYAHDRTLSACLMTLLLLEAGFKVGMSIYLDNSQHIVAAGLANSNKHPFCDNMSFPTWWLGLIDWVVPMVFGVILMALALYKAAEYWRESAGFQGFTLVKVLIQDQLIYFSFVVFCAVINIINFRIEVSSPFTANVLICFGNPSFLCVLGSRMIVNLKEAGEEGRNTINMNETSSSTIARAVNMDPPTPTATPTVLPD
ncbi:uncharacterized protein FOMMEDRAFT_161282 [Fomitiporia mediterranea MF3/22]|uniref:uncharacterized protein n=1 Tax=Fomitiporia mediterranea (strain MF3/22) TaxID=694068 RepID=UPI000440970C|nr:uncharacterized protein FOMMEDRAFT_161282 [Fomitiporia mediterranea MF3/22]EJC99054.1 hypothetical protein FOMMEDRAFT_161282 [Fomitiporia mediterranea MF3/22]